MADLDQVPPLSGLTPLADVAAVSLDLETTGLNVANDRVIQIGAICLSGPVIHDAPCLDAFIDPKMPVPATASRITGITAEHLKDAASLEDIFPALLDLLGNRILIGHHIAFDRAILRSEAKRLGMPWTDPPSLDVGHLMGALDPSLPDLGLDAVATALDIDIHARHTAVGDATAVAEMYVKLLPRLYDRGIRTFAEAQAFAARRSDLRQMEVTAGWIEAADIPVTDRGASAGHIDSVVFSRRASDVMSAPPRFIDPSATVAEAATVMIENRIGSLLVGSETRPPLGIITERDLLRLFAENRPTQTVSQTMSKPVESVGKSERLYRILGRMDRLSIRHLAVTDADGLAVGVVSQRDLLIHRARAESLIKDTVECARTVRDLTVAQARLPTIAQGLLNDAQDGLTIAGVIARELQATTAKAAELALQDMTDAPAPWCLMVLGSGGRGESLLAADQDNALIYRGDESCDPWFAEFGAKLSENLNAAGIPFCNGGIMGSNPQWRGTEGQWRARVDEWLGRANHEDILNIDIFFDLCAVAGDASLANDLHAEAVDGAARTRSFLSLMATSTSALAPQFGMFGGLKVERGRIDLKRQVLLPLVSFARCVALACGVRDVGTQERLSAIIEHQRLGRGDGLRLTALHRQVMTLILRQQIDDLARGQKPSNRIDISKLSSIESSDLKDGIHTLAGIVGQTHGLIT